MPAPKKLNLAAFPQTFMSSVLANCREDGDCLEWLGPFQTRVPIVMVPRACMPDSVMRPKQDTVYVSVRRAVHALKIGVDKHTMIVGNCCKNALCINPEHTRAYGRREFAMRMSAGARKNDTERGRKISATVRAKSKLDIHQVREIRTSELSCDAEAEARGVHPSLISAIRRGKTWKDYECPMGGMAAQLMGVA